MYRSTGRRADGDIGVHRRVLHHRRGRPLGLDHGHHRLDVAHEQEHAGHHVQQEIPPDPPVAEADQQEDGIEDHHQHHHLGDVQHQPQDGVAMALADRPDGGVKGQLGHGECRDDAPEWSLPACIPGFPPRFGLPCPARQG